MPPKRKSEKSDWVKDFIFIVVVVIWATGIVVDFISDSYTIPVEITGLVAAIIGYFVREKWQEQKK